MNKTDDSPRVFQFRSPADLRQPDRDQHYGTDGGRDDFLRELDVNPSADRYGQNATDEKWPRNFASTPEAGPHLPVFG